MKDFCTILLFFYENNNTIMTEHVIHLTDEDEYPWSIWIEKGWKIYEGRLSNKELLKKLKEGDKITFIVKQKNGSIKLVKCNYICLTKEFLSFKDAYLTLGEQLVPIASSVEAVEDVYKKYFPIIPDGEGVICIKIQYISTSYQ